MKDIIWERIDLCDEFTALHVIGLPDCILNKFRVNEVIVHSNWCKSMIFTSEYLLTLNSSMTWISLRHYILMVSVIRNYRLNCYGKQKYNSVLITIRKVLCFCRLLMRFHFWQYASFTIQCWIDYICKYRSKELRIKNENWSTLFSFLHEKIKLN